MKSGRAKCAVWLAVASLFGVVAAASAQAQSGSPAQAMLTDSFVFNAGIFVVGSDTKAKVNGQSVSNPDIDFDQTFGKASDATRWRLDGLWRFTPNHHLRALYFDSSLTRNKTLTQDIKWDNAVYKVGANVEAKNSIKVFELAYEYAFMHEPTYELAATFGVHYADIKLGLAGAASVTDANGNVTQKAFESRSSNLPAPFPVIGFRAAWAASPQWYLDAQAQVFKYKVDGYDGNWSDVRLGATWMYARNWGVGMGYNRFTTRVDVTKPTLQGNVKLGYSGLQAFLTGSF